MIGASTCDKSHEDLSLGKNVWYFRQLVADDRWSQLEVELYFDQHEY